MTEVLVTRIIDNAIAIKEGFLEFTDEEFGIHYRIRVKQHQSEGAAYYRNTISPDDDHVEIMQMLTSTEYLATGKFTYHRIYDQLKLWRLNHGSTKPVAFSPFKARLSEMKSKGVFEITHENRKTLYRIRSEYAAKVLETGKY